MLIMKYFISVVFISVLFKVSIAEVDFLYDQSGMISVALEKVINPSSIEDIEEVYQSSVFSRDGYNDETTSLLQFAISTSPRYIYQIDSVYYVAEDSALVLVYSKWKISESKDQSSKYILIGNVISGKVIFNDDPQLYSEKLHIASVEYLMGMIDESKYKKIKAENWENSNLEILRKLNAERAKKKE